MFNNAQERHNMANTIQQLPETGFVRLPAILRVIPVSRSTWWQWVRDGKAPKPVKLAARTTAWKATDISDFILQAGK